MKKRFFYFFTLIIMDVIITKYSLIIPIIQK